MGRKETYLAYCLYLGPIFKKWQREVGFGPIESNAEPNQCCQLFEGQNYGPLPYQIKTFIMPKKSHLLHVSHENLHSENEFPITFYCICDNFRDWGLTPKEILNLGGV